MGCAATKEDIVQNVEIKAKDEPVAKPAVVLKPEVVQPKTDVILPEKPQKEAKEIKSSEHDALHLTNEVQTKKMPAVETLSVVSDSEIVKTLLESPVANTVKKEEWVEHKPLNLILSPAPTKKVEEEEVRNEMVKNIPDMELGSTKIKLAPITYNARVLPPINAVPVSKTVASSSNDELVHSVDNKLGDIATFDNSKFRAVNSKDNVNENVNKPVTLTAPLVVHSEPKSNLNVNKQPNPVVSSGIPSVLSAEEEELLAGF